MRRWLYIVFMTSLLVTKTAWGQEGDGVRFMPMEVWIDAGGQALAAYQLEVNDPEGRARVVGIEGGDHSAFEQPPFYDPAALTQERVILAAFSTNDRLPRGRVRVATLHLEVRGAAPVEPTVELTVAAGSDAQPISAEVELVQGEQP